MVKIGAVLTQENTPALIDSSVPHPARRYNYWLDGNDNFAADRASADAIVPRSDNFSARGAPLMLAGAGTGQCRVAT